MVAPHAGSSSKERTWRSIVPPSRAMLRSVVAYAVAWVAVTIASQCEGSAIAPDISVTPSEAVAAESVSPSVFTS